MPPAELFAAAARPGREHALAELGLELVARPGMTPPAEAPPGLFAVRRALGEANLAVILAVERIDTRARLESAGIPCEGRGGGVFMGVGGGPTGQRGLRIAGADAIVCRHGVRLRARPAHR